MQRRSESLRAILLFLVRSLVLYFLLVNSFLQLRDQLDLAFQSASFLGAVLAGVLMERAKLRFLPSLALAVLLPILLRALFFLVFRLQRAIASAPATDFLFFYFDKDFIPSLAGYAIAWLFTFLAMRHRGFPFVEVGLNALLLVAVFWSQAGYRLSLYPHPSIFAWALALFIVGQFFVLLLAGARGAEHQPGPRAVLGFAWIILPLILVFLLFLLGRYGEGAVKAGGGLMKPTLFRFDFAPYVRLESEIRQSDQTVLLFRTEGMADRYLLRRFVLSGYAQNQGFFMERGKGMDEQSSVVPDSPERFVDPGYAGRTLVSQEYFFLTIDPSSLIALNYPVRVAPLKNWQSSSFLRVYRVDSKAAKSTGPPTVVSKQPALAPALQTFYTAGGGDEEVRTLALEVTAGQEGYHQKVAAIVAYLRMNYLYSLKPGIAEDGNQLHHFLFVSRKGYCSYFAFAMALMCRSIGIPARVAVGFYVDPRSEVLNFYEVRAFQAHAWVEVWFGDLGWLEFDPTSEIPAPGEDLLPFPGPDRNRMAQLIAEILGNKSEEEDRASAAPSVIGTASKLAAEMVRLALLVARLWYVLVPCLYALLLVSRKLLPSRPGRLSRNPRRCAKAGYHRCMVTLSSVGLGRLPNETPLEHASRVDAERGLAFGPVVEGYLAASFAEAFGHSDLARATTARAGFRASFRRRVSLARRMLGVLRP
jgi:transglutaminase-like putative cysteine protease